MKAFRDSCRMAASSFCVLAMLSADWLTPAMAQAQEEESFAWSVTPYLWASETRLDLTLRDGISGGDKLSFGDLLDMLDSAIMVHVEGGKGNWSMFGDLTYLDLSETDERSLITIDSNSQQTFLDAGLAYWPNGVGSNLSLVGGLRYSGFDDRYTFRVSDEIIATHRNSPDYYDAMLGMRYRFNLSERWSLLARRLQLWRFRGHLRAERQLRPHRWQAPAKPSPVRLPVQTSRVQGWRTDCQVPLPGAVGRVQFPLVRLLSGLS